MNNKLLRQAVLVALGLISVPLVSGLPSLMALSPNPINQSGSFAWDAKNSSPKDVEALKLRLLAERASSSSLSRTHSSWNGSAWDLIPLALLVAGSGMGVWLLVFYCRFSGQYRRYKKQAFDLSASIAKAGSDVNSSDAFDDHDKLIGVCQPVESAVAADLSPPSSDGSSNFLFESKSTQPLIRRITSNTDLSPVVLELSVKERLYQCIESYSTLDWNLWRVEHPDVEIDFNEIDLQKACLFGFDLSYVNFSRANLKGARLGQSDLSFANFESADLSCADLSFASLQSANLARAKAIRVKATYIKAKETCWSRAVLTRADLSSAELQGADLSCVDARFSDFTCAELVDCNLARTNFANAILCGANFSDSVIYGADFSSSDSDSDCFAGCKVDEATVLPKDEDSRSGDRSLVFSDSTEDFGL